MLLTTFEFPCGIIYSRGYIILPYINARVTQYLKIYLEFKNLRRNRNFKLKIVTYNNFDALRII
jgi:hypothetical protein